MMQVIKKLNNKHEEQQHEELNTGSGRTEGRVLLLFSENDGGGGARTWQAGCLCPPGGASCGASSGCWGRRSVRGR